MDNFNQIALIFILAVPLFTGGALIFFPRNKIGAIRTFALAGSLLTFLLSFYVFVMYDYHEGGYQFVGSVIWLMDPLNIQFSFGIDGISAPMILLTGIVMLAGTMMSWNIEYRSKDFFVLFMFLVAGVFGTFSVRDIFFLFFFYELAVLPMFPLIAVWGSTTDFGSFLRTKEYSAMKLTLYLVAGSVLVWIGIIALFIETTNAGAGTFSIETLSQLSEDGVFSRKFQIIFFPFFMIGFGVLAGLWPFHTWSPDGHVAAGQPARQVGRDGSGSGAAPWAHCGLDAARLGGAVRGPPRCGRPHPHRGGEGEEPRLLLHRG